MAPFRDPSQHQPGRQDKSTREIDFTKAKPRLEYGHGQPNGEDEP
jgi:hypothetical protein